MKSTAIVLVVLLSVVFLGSVAFGSDPDKTPTTRVNPQGVPQEGFEPMVPAMATMPVELEEALKNALESNNTQEARRIEGLMKLYQPSPLMRNAVPADPDIYTPGSATQVASPLWSGTDVVVYTGNVKYGGLREIDVKKGDDGNLYMVINKTGITGYTGRADVYKSTNGGTSWAVIGAIGSSTAYYGEVSMLVELRHPNNFDSTRICLFYTRSTTANMDNATIRYASMLRDGSAFMGGSSEIETPVTGHKFGSPSAYSDGAYYSTGTYLGLVAAEYTNNGDTSKSLRVYRSTDWGVNWTGATVSASYSDFYPTAALKPGVTWTSDSVFIAIERRFSSTNSLVRVIATKFNPPTSDHATYYLPPSDPSSKYEKPYINVRQTGRSYGIDRDVLITMKKNGNGYYHCMVAGQNTWQLDYNLASSVNVAYTFSASDSLTSGGGYFLVAYTDVNGDTLGVRRGVLGSLGTRIYHNDHKTSTSVLPACVIYRVGTTKYSAYAYAGLGPINVYFNQELLTGVANTTPELPVEFTLQQNYPNPFNPTTGIRYQVPGASDVKLVVYDMLGKEVAVLVNERKAPGSYEARFDGSGLASGVYVYRLTAGSFAESRKMVLIK